MGLKLLVIPGAILIVLVVIIGFVKPDLTVLEEKKNSYEAKLDQSRNMDSLLKNIDSLTASLNNRDEDERFVQNYLPKKMDQGRVIDMFNFLASQSGVAVSIMNLSEVDMNRASVTEVYVDPAALVPVAPAVSPESFSVIVTVGGQYENIKDFFQRVAHMNRFHKTRNFSIAASEKNQSGGDKEDTTGTLIGKFEADFDYFDVVTGGNALSLPVFSRERFDPGPLDRVTDWITDTVPSLEKPETGRANPFR